MSGEEPPDLPSIPEGEPLAPAPGSSVLDLEGPEPPRSTFLDRVIGAISPSGPRRTDPDTSDLAFDEFGHLISSPSEGPSAADRRAQQEAAERRRRIQALLTAHLETRPTRPPTSRTMGTVINPYAAPINLGDRTGIAPCNKGAEPLPSKFDGTPAQLPTFLAELKTRSDKCDLTAILTIDCAGTNYNLLSQHGNISLTHVNAAARTRQEHVTASTITVPQAQAVIKHRMLFECITSSLTAQCTKNLTGILGNLNQDGTVLLFHLISKAHVTTVLATRDTLQDIKSMDFKDYKYDIKRVHGQFDIYMSQLVAANAGPDELNQIVMLFDIYRTNKSNDTFQRYIDDLESDWSRSVITTPAELREKVETHINQMIRRGTWKPTRRTQPQEPTALTTDGGKPPARPTSTSTTDKAAAIEKLKAKNPKWKFDRSKSSSTTFTNNGKTHNWCTGPGHYGVGMWVIHKPGECTGAAKPPSSTQANATEASTSSTKTRKSKKAFKAHIAQVLSDSNQFGDDVTSLVSKIAEAYE